MFDMIGDVHGCYDELLELIELLGYQKTEDHLFHPDGRQLVFVGEFRCKVPHEQSLDLWLSLAAGKLEVLKNTDHGDHTLGSEECQSLVSLLIDGMRVIVGILVNLARISLFGAHYHQNDIGDLTNIENGINIFPVNLYEN